MEEESRLIIFRICFLVFILFLKENFHLAFYLKCGIINTESTSAQNNRTVNRIKQNHNECEMKYTNKKTFFIILY